MIEFRPQPKLDHSSPKLRHGLPRPRQCPLTPFPRTAPLQPSPACRLPSPPQSPPVASSLTLLLRPNPPAPPRNHLRHTPFPMAPQHLRNRHHNTRLHWPHPPSLLGRPLHVSPPAPPKPHPLFLRRTHRNCCTDCTELHIMRLRRRHETASVRSGSGDGCNELRNHV